MGNLNTPVRQAPNSENEPTERCNVTRQMKPTQSSTPSTSKAKNGNDDESPVVQQEDIRLFWEEIRAFRIEMTNFREAVSELTSAVKMQNHRSAGD